METGSVWVQGQAWVTLTLLLLLLLLDLGTRATRVGPPGKPRLVGCQSPEKETFTCWWEPGSTGGLPTTHALFYHRENSDAVHECPDYRSAGENSCFFDKSHTSLWVSYNITVVASNDLGSSSSDSMDVDVVYIVKPPHPENVTVTLEYGENLYLQVKWEPPGKVDTRSGWITLSYQLLVKREKGNEWERHFAGQQKHFQIFSPHPEETYAVKVRCRPDHGFWSEWSAPAYVQVPIYLPRERSIWIFLTIFSIFILLILMWILVLKKNSVKQFILPPVPGPKIKGFDNHLLKKGRSEDIFSVLISPGFPLTSESEDLLVEYLEVYESVDQEPARVPLQGGKEAVCTPMMGRKEATSMPVMGGKEQAKEQSSVTDKIAQHLCTGDTSLKTFGGQSVTLGDSIGDPPVTVRLPDSNQNHKTDKSESVDRRNDAATSPCQCSCVQESPYHVPEVPTWGPPAVSQQDQQDVSGESHLSSLPADPESEGGQCSMRQMEECTTTLPLPTEYVEVQKVNQQNRLILKPKSREDGADLRGQDYSKVSQLVNDRVFLLGQSPPQVGPDHGVSGECAQQPPPVKPAFHPNPNGYVDTIIALSSS